MEGTKENKDDEDQVRQLTSETYFASINVEATLNQLQELAYQNVKGKGQFEDDNRKEYHAISENITELSRQRNDLHDLLEIETINANKRRRALQVLPKSFNAQMQDAVLVARQQNSDRIMSLQRKLNSLKDEAVDVEKRMEELNTENIKLKPECEQIRKEHDQIIALLNQRMSIKSSKQIVLNETCDTLREVRQQTAEIDIGLENLAEDLENDKKEAAAVKSELLKETAETEAEIAETKAKIDEEKKILNSLMEQSTEKSVEVQERRKIISRLENSVTRLQMDTMQLSGKIERERRANQATMDEIDRINEFKEKDGLMYQEKIDGVEKKVHQSLREKHEAEEENSKVTRLKDQNTRFLADAKMKKESYLKQAKDSAKEFERLKVLVSQRIEEAGNISLLNAALEEKMKELDENHRATVELYQSQTEELTDHLNKEKGERVKVQHQREESEKHLESFKTEEMKFMNNITSRIRTATSAHKKLADQSLSLSQANEKNKRHIDTLEVKLEVAHGSLRSMKTGLQLDLERLKKNIESLKEDVARKRQIRDDMGPVLEEMQRNNEELNEEYNEAKSKMMAIRNQEKSLTEQKNRTKIMLDKIRKAINELKFKVAQAHKKCREQLQKENQDRDSMEAGINQIIKQMEIIYMSNKHFREGTDRIDADFNLLMNGMNNSAKQQRLLLQQFKDIQEKFAQSWSVTLAMEQASADHDAQLLTDIRRVQKETDERAAVLQKIAADMEDDLEELTNFTENVNSRRPKDTRQSKRASRRGVREQNAPKKPPQLVRVVSLRRPQTSHLPCQSVSPRRFLETRRMYKYKHLKLRENFATRRPKSADQPALAIESPIKLLQFLTDASTESLQNV